MKWDFEHSRTNITIHKTCLLSSGFVWWNNLIILNHDQLITIHYRKNFRLSNKGAHCWSWSSRWAFLSLKTSTFPIKRNYYINYNLALNCELCFWFVWTSHNKWLQSLELWVAMNLVHSLSMIIYHSLTVLGSIPNQTCSVLQINNLVASL